MTQREKELTEALASMVQKSERLCDAIAELEEAETAYKANWDVAVGSEPWMAAVVAMKAARSRLRGSRIIQQAATREATDSLYPDSKRAVA